jgi:hypothetical protein
MSGPIVRSGPSPEFSRNWDSVFGKSGKKPAAKAAPAKAKKKAKPSPKKAATKKKKKGGK